jgi:hypothetical protein
MSTAKDRLYQVYLPYKLALDRRPRDLAEAADTAQVHDILGHIDGLQAHYFRAARTELEATGAEVEGAYQAAKDATAKVTEAYEASMALAERIRRMAQVVAKVGELVTKAAS